jgi:plastocyanin
MHKEMPTTHFYVVGPKGGFGDVVVSLKGIHGKSTGPEAKPLVIEQKGCLYHPYISACQTGQKIIVRNLDPVLHNVHVAPTNPANPEENRAQLPHGPDLSFTFKAPESFITFKCDVHPWMFAFVSVFDNPFFSVSNQEGHYRIHNVPPGHYTVVAAHRKAGTLEKTVDVQNHDVELDFTFGTKAVS